MNVATFTRNAISRRFIYLNCRLMMALPAQSFRKTKIVTQKERLLVIMPKRIVRISSNPILQLLNTSRTGKTTSIVTLTNRRRAFINQTIEAAAAIVVGIVALHQSHNKHSLAAAMTGQERLLESQPIPSTAADVETNSAILCDPCISVWTFGEGKSSCTVYLLGTVHISESSGILAGALVRHVIPDAVFVELDFQRMPYIPSSSRNDNGDVFVVLNGEWVRKRTRRLPTKTSSSPSADSESTAAKENTTSSSGNKNVFQRWISSVSSAVFVTCAKTIYSFLKSLGFKPGEEFLEAIRSGRDVGAAIALGDQDIQVTEQRLGEVSLIQSVRAMMFQIQSSNPDAPLERDNSHTSPSLDTNADKNNSSSPLKRYLSDWITTTKSRETVRTSTQRVAEVAPDFVHVMITERDTYMANGIHMLVRSFPTIVAVIGMGHLDGIERNLQSLGWKQVHLTCSKE